MKIPKLGGEAVAFVALTAVSVATAFGSGCSAKRPTELVPGISSQVVVPRDLAAVRVTVTVNGGPVFDRTYDVGTDSTVRLPSTLGVLSNGSANDVVTITVRGYETPCGQSTDCNLLGDAPVGANGSRILRRSVQTFVDQRTLYVPMPLSYSCWNTDCGSGVMGCKGNRCVDVKSDVSTLVDFSPSLLDGTDVCFSPRACFGDQPDGGKNLAFPPLLVDGDTCTYSLPAIPGDPSAAGNVNVRAYYQNFAWTKDAAGTFQSTFKSGGEQEILNEDGVEGFTLVGNADSGPANAGDATTTFRLAPGLCELVKQGRNPPTRPPSGAATYIAISDLRVANLCPPKTPLLPICAGERTNGPALPTGESTTDGVCNVGVTLTPTQSALYLVMDHSAVMHGAFGPMGSATALSLSLNDPVFKRTFAAFKFLPGQAADCSSPSTSLTMPDVPFGLAGAVQAPIAAQLKNWTASDTTAAPTPLELQAAMRLDAGAYTQVISFLQGKELPNIAAAMFFVNRAPDLTNDCSPPLVGQATVKDALEREILNAFQGSPSVQTYFVVLDDDAHDTSAPGGALTFFNQVQADLPQAVQVLDATQTSSMAAAQTAAANFAKLVTQLGTCVYDYGLPTATDKSRVEVAFSAPGLPATIVPAAAACTAATQGSVDGWNLDGGRLRICGNSCKNLRQAILASSAAALQSKQAAPDIPVTAKIVCPGNVAPPVNDLGPADASASTSADARTDATANSGPDATGGTLGAGSDSSSPTDGPAADDAASSFADSGVASD